MSGTARERMLALLARFFFLAHLIEPSRAMIVSIRLWQPRLMSIVFWPVFRK